MEVREVTIYIAIPHLSPIGLSVIHQADEKHVDVTFQRLLFGHMADVWLHSYMADIWPHS